jgi:hypothetical protein
MRHAARPSDALPKKIYAPMDRCQLRQPSENRLFMKNK